MPRKPELTEQEWSHFFDVADMDDDSLSLSIEPSEEAVSYTHLTLPTIYSV